MSPPGNRPRLLAAALGSIAALAAAFARPAAAQSDATVAVVRESRPISVGVSLAWPRSGQQDITIPVPVLRVGVNLSPRLTVDLTAGTTNVVDSSTHFGLVDLGVRWFFTDGRLSPYVLGRVGEYLTDNDDVPDRTSRYGALGVGLEYAGRSGLCAWAEGGPALLGGDGGTYASLGVGYRFGPARP